MNDQCTVLYTSIVGSHAWGMEHKDSDWDFTTIYQAPSDEILVGTSAYVKGHNHSGVLDDGVPWDQNFLEVGRHIQMLIGGNINQFVTMLARPVYHVHGIMNTPDKRWRHRIGPPQYVQLKLRKLVEADPARNIFHSINGMITANLRKYFGKGKRFHWDKGPWQAGTRQVEEWLTTRGKKLAQIERLVMFGYSVLTEQDYELRPCKLSDGMKVDEDRVRQWQQDLIHAYNYSDLPEKPDPQPFLDYLFDLRLDDIICNYNERLSDVYLQPPDY